MAGFPFNAARGLGGTQIFLGLAAMGLGIFELMAGVPDSRDTLGPRFPTYLMGTAIWTGLLFLTAGSLAASIKKGQTAGCKIGAAQTLSLVNAVLFAPGLITTSSISHFITSTTRNFLLPGIEISLIVIGILEFIFALATACVCCCGGPYDQPAAVSAGHAERNTGAPAPVPLPRLSAGSDGQMVTISAADLGVLYASSQNLAK